MERAPIVDEQPIAPADVAAPADPATEPAEVAAAPVAREADRQRRKWATWAARLLVSLGVVVWLYQSEDVRHAFSELSPRTEGWIAAGIVLYAGCQLLNAYKWGQILRAMGYRLPYLELVRVTFIGMFSNLLLPTAVGGDVVRVGVMRTHDVPASVGALSVFTQRVTGFLAMLVIGVVGALAAGALADPLPRRAFIGMAVLLLGVTAAAVAGAFLERHLDLGQRLPRWLGGPLSRLGQGLRALAKAPGRMVWVMVLSFAFQLWQVGIGIMLAQPAAVDTPVRNFFWVGPLTSLAPMLPVFAGGFGGREAAARLLTPVLGPHGVPWQVLWDAMVLLTSLLAGLIVVVGNRRRAAKS
jgi:uncharacterized protein (TIRG00374 family)